MMTKLEQAARQALDALEWVWGGEPLATMELQAITALREALANTRSSIRSTSEYSEQAEQEPVANMEVFSGWEDVANVEVFEDIAAKLPDGNYMLYAAPVQQVDLTDVEVENVWRKHGGYMTMPIDFARAVIAADREKNK